MPDYAVMQYQKKGTDRTQIEVFTQLSDAKDWLKLYLTVKPQPKLNASRIKGSYFDPDLEELVYLEIIKRD